MIDIKALIEPYSPWHESAKLKDWEQGIPPFRRPVFERLWKELETLPQILSLTGPRRVGKSTLLKQLIAKLMASGTPPGNILYYSLDDPARFRSEQSGSSVVEALVKHLQTRAPKSGKTYLFLDEIQTLDRWEQYLKKYYDLEYPIRFVISGSASGPIFKKSRESLLGRVKDYHILPFSFSEFLRYRVQDDQELTKEIQSFTEAGNELEGMFTEHPGYLQTDKVKVPVPTPRLWQVAQEALNTYFLEGGFPEVWRLPTSDLKLEYLFDNQVKKVIQEDLVLAAEFRKPEQLKAFYISLLERPGREVSLVTLAKEAAVNVQQVEKYLPLLEMTDLLAHASKFRHSAIRVRPGNRKFYLVDLALRNAVLRLGPALLQDDATMGLYAENLVFNALRKWQGLLQVDYFHQGNKEIDFIAHARSREYLPIEVKYKNQIDSRELKAIQEFQSKYDSHVAIIITKKQNDFGPHDNGLLYYLPLLIFLLMQK